MAKIQAVIFDMDDTLFPERQFAFSGFLAVAEAFQSQLGDVLASTSQMCVMFDTPDRRRVFNAMLELHGQAADQATIDGMIETYRTHTPKINLFEDAARALHRLKGKFKLGVISDGPLTMQQGKVEALALRDKVDEVILTAELGEGFGKPHPKAFELMAERLGVAHEACVYVADNASKDFVGPNGLGWMSVQIVRAGGIYAEVKTADGGAAGQIIRSLDELMKDGEG